VAPASTSILDPPKPRLHTQSQTALRLRPLAVQPSRSLSGNFSALKSSNGSPRVPLHRFQTTLPPSTPSKRLPSINPDPTLFDEHSVIRSLGLLLTIIDPAERRDGESSNALLPLHVSEVGRPQARQPHDWKGLDILLKSHHYRPQLPAQVCPVEHQIPRDLLDRSVLYPSLPMAFNDVRAENRRFDASKSLVDLFVACKAAVKAVKVARIYLGELLLHVARALFHQSSRVFNPLAYLVPLLRRYLPNSTYRFVPVQSPRRGGRVSLLYIRRPDRWIEEILQSITGTSNKITFNAALPQTSIRGLIFTAGTGWMRYF
jgi:hypothetical protein